MLALAYRFASFQLVPWLIVLLSAKGRGPSPQRQRAGTRETFSCSPAPKGRKSAIFRIHTKVIRNCRDRPIKKIILYEGVPMVRVSIRLAPQLNRLVKIKNFREEYFLKSQFDLSLNSMDGLPTGTLSLRLDSMYNRLIKINRNFGGGNS